MCMLIVGADPFDRPRDHVEEVLGLVRVAGEARLVELDEVDPVVDHGASARALTIGISASVTALAVVVHVAPGDAARPG